MEFRRDSNDSLIGDACVDVATLLLVMSSLMVRCRLDGFLMLRTS